MPASLAQALGHLGCDVQFVGARPEPLAVHVAGARAVSRVAVRGGLSRGAISTTRSAALLAEPVVASRTRQVARTVRTLPACDAYIQLTSDFELPDGLRLATFEDQTVRQAVSSGAYGWMSRLSDAERDGWIDRQRRIYGRATTCTTRYHGAADSIVRDYGVDAARVVTVGPGANRRVAPPANRDWTVPRFVTVGLDWERKNGARVMRAFSRVREEQPDAELHLIGIHPDGDEPGVVRHGQLHFGDPAAEQTFHEVFERATCFVLPSIHDPGPISYLEAAHAGLPVIGSDVRGGNTITGSAATMVDPFSEDAIADAMRLLSDPSEAASRGAALRRRTSSMTWDNAAWRLLDALGIDPPAVDGPPPSLPLPSE